MWPGVVVVVFGGRVVHRILGQFGQLAVGRAFLGQDPLQVGLGLIHPQGLGKGAHRAVTCDLVMLDRLTAEDDRGVGGNAVTEILQQAFALFQDAVDGVAFHGLGTLAQQLENRLQGFDLACGLLAMRGQGGDKVGMVCRLDHLGQRLVDFLLGVIHVRQGVLEQIRKALVRRRGLGGLGLGFRSHGLRPLGAGLGGGFRGLLPCRAGGFLGRGLGLSVVGGGRHDVSPWPGRIAGPYAVDETGGRDATFR